MVKLSAELFRTTGDDAYLAYAERALANHLLSTQHPEHGGVVYFTSMRPGHYRTYSAREEGFWCCVGTGLETHTRHGALAFSTADDELGVNLLIDATARWHDRGVTVRVSSGYPLSERATIEVETDRAGPVHARRPHPHVGGRRGDRDRGRRAADARRRPGSGCASTASGRASRRSTSTCRRARGSSRVRTADRGRRSCGVRSSSRTACRTTRSTTWRRPRGWATSPADPLRPLLDAPVLGPQSAGSVARTSTGFTVRDVDGTPIDLEPFATLHDARYVAAWPYAPDGDAAARRAELAAVDEASLSLAARTLDEVAFGEQQPEVDHGVPGSARRQGEQGDARWRSTTQDVRLTLFDWRSTASSIRLEWLGDTGPTALRVLVAGQVVLDDELAPAEPHAPERPRGRPSAGAARRRDPGRDPRRRAACRPLVCCGCVSWPPRGTDHARAPVTGPV